MNYGQGNTTYLAAGKREGISILVDAFYDLMANESVYQTLHDMHKGDNITSREKLTTFLSGWMGGPSEYAEKYGAINIPAAHKHLKINAQERDLWVACMKDALDLQPYPKSLKIYLIKQLSIPAERIRQASQFYSEQKR